MKKLCWTATLTLSIFYSLSAYATSTIVTYAFDDGTSFLNPGVTVSDPAITTGAWTDNAGTIQSLKGQSGSPGDYAIAATNFVGGNTFHFSITVNSGSLSLDGYSFWQQGSGGSKGNGPTDWALSINNQQVATGSTVLGSPGGAESGPLTLAGLTGTVDFAISATGATADSATWRVDNFSLTGNVSAVPLPPALFLFSSALLPLLIRRRRRI